MAEYIETKRELQLASRKVLTDDVNGDGTLVYTGWGARGAALSDEVWFIRKTVVAGAITTNTHASAAYDTEWDERAAATYT